MKFFVHLTYDFARHFCIMLRRRCEERFLRRSNPFFIPDDRLSGLLRRKKRSSQRRCRTMLGIIGFFASVNIGYAEMPPSAAPSVTPPTANGQAGIPLGQFQEWLKNNEHNLPSNIALPGSSAGNGKRATPPPTNTAPPSSISRSRRALRGAPGEMSMESLSRPPLVSLPPPPPLRRVRMIPPRKPLTYEQSQEVMLKSLPADNPPPSDDAIIAFNTMLQNNMPMSPSQVLMLHQQIDRAQRAAATPPLVPPKPVSSTIMVNLAPGATPPAIRLALGYVTSLVFVDSTGAPWPIAAFDVGNPKASLIQWDGKSNILLIQALAAYSYGDIVVRLVGLPTPVTLELVSGQRVVDYRIDIHVSGIGPNTKELPIGTSLPNSANQLLLGVLDGVAPPGSRVLSVAGSNDSQAWLVGDTLFLRTRLTVLSPGWIGKMSSPDGMQAYEMPKTSSILISRYGEPAELKIEGL